MLLSDLSNITSKIDLYAGLRLSIDKIHIAFWIKEYINGKFIMRYLNDEYEKKYLTPKGIKKSDYIGKTDFDIWDQETAENFYQNDLQTLRDKHDYEYYETYTLEGKTIKEKFIKSYVVDALTGKQYIPGTSVIVD